MAINPVDYEFAFPLHEKIITAETGQESFAFLLGDRLLFVAHGVVIAGVDLEQLGPDDLRVEIGQVLSHALGSITFWIDGHKNETNFISVIPELRADLQEFCQGHRANIRAAGIAKEHDHYLVSQLAELERLPVHIGQYEMRCSYCRFDQRALESVFTLRSQDQDHGNQARQDSQPENQDIAWFHFNPVQALEITAPRI